MESTAMKITEGSPSSLMITSGASGRVNALVSLKALKSLMMLLNVILLVFLAPFRRRKIKHSFEKSKEEKQEPTTCLRKSKASPRLRAVSAVVQRNHMSIDLDILTRRSLAARRVELDDDPNLVRQYSTFFTSRSGTLFTQSWTPVFAHIRGLVILMHGLNEHSGRYDYFAKKLNAEGYKVYAMDWIGHGGSDELHGYVHSLDYAISDLKEFVEKLLAENSGLPCFCFGHSTGGAIVIKASLDPKFETLIDGIVLTSPAIQVQPAHPIFEVLAPMFSILLPRYQIGFANKSSSPVSRDAAAIVAKYTDPLVYTGAIRIRTGYEILQITSYLQQNLNQVRVPFLVLHGSADTVTNPTASQKLYDIAPSKDKNIILYEGLLHDLLFEIEREDVIKDIINWLNTKINEI